MHVVLAIALVLGDPFADAWPEIRDAFPGFSDARVELAHAGRVRVRLTRDTLDPGEYDAMLAALAPHVGAAMLALEVIGPDGRDLTPAPLSREQVVRLVEQWRAQHQPRRVGRQIGDEPRGALTGVRVAVSAGHGTHWVNGAWEYQRSLQFQLREDIHTNEVVFRHLAPMLERAGAEVVLVRDRSVHPVRVVVDNDDGDGSYQEEGEWSVGASPGHDGTYRYAWVRPEGGARATWQFTVGRPEEVPLFVWYRAGGNRSDSARFEVTHAGGVDVVEIDQRRLDSRWRYLGTFPFLPERAAAVTLSNVGTDTSAVVIADAVRLAGGPGFADYGGGVSGHARWQQSASTFAMEEEVPPLVTADTNDVNVRPSLALWQGVDLYISIHTNAAGGSGTSSFVYSSAVPYPGFDSERATPLPPGTLELQEAVHASAVATFRAQWDSEWIDRGLWGADFGELRPLHHAWQVDAGVVVPATLIELAFHDNADDAFFLREDEFRRDAARAIVRGIIQFVHRADPVSAVMPPRAPTELVARQSEHGVVLSWAPTPDAVDSTAAPSWYEVQVSDDGWSFGEAVRTVDPWLELRDLSTCDPIAARVVAGNAGGRSMPSRTAVTRVMSAAPRVLWVDGVRRLHRTADDAPGGPNTAARVLIDLIAAAGGGLGVDTARVEVVQRGEVALTDWDLVLWSTGETSAYDGTLAPAEQSLVAAYLAGGGALVLSGADIGWDLVERGDAADQTFFADVLRAAYVGDDADTFAVGAHGSASWLAGTAPLRFDDGSGGSYRVEYPDVLAEHGGSAAELVYATGGVAALRFEGAGRLFFAGFPLEAIDSDSARAGIMDALVASLVTAPVPQAVCGVPYGEPREDGGPAGDADGGVTPAGDGDGDESSEERVDGGCGCRGGSAVAWPGLALVLLARRRQRARA